MKTKRIGRFRRASDSGSRFPNGIRKAGWAAVAIIVFGLALSPSAALGKKKPPPTRTVTGEVMDASNNSIVGAAVELTDVETGKKVAIYTEASGRYRFAGLSPTHTYKVQASYGGTSSATRTASSLSEDEPVVLNLIISPPPQ